MKQAPPRKARYTIAKKQRGRPIEYDNSEDLHKGADAKRYCICGQPLKIKWRLCHNCLAKYGDKAAEWPEWLQEWMRSMNNEVNHNRRNYELELYDEYATDVIEGARMSKAVDVSDSYDMTKPAGMKWNVSTTRSIAVSKERDKTENSILINELLQGLTEREREVIELHYYDDLTQAEVGRALGISQVMVSKIIAAVIKRARNGSNKG